MKKTNTVIAAFILAACALPVVSEAKTRYISPNSDGVQDELVIPLKISDKRYVEAWNLIITDASGKTVRTIGNKVALPAKVTFKSFFKQLFTPKEGVEIPEEVIWNGAMDNGENAPDGTYTYYFTATDDNGNTGKTDSFTVVIDTQAPDINLTQPSDRIFGEGAKSSFKISQSGSAEDLWTGRFRKADGTVVRTFKWTNAEPAVFSWNGNDDNGTPVADGVYSYDITATDRAGNKSAPASVANIIYSAEKPATNITISGSRYFSPNTESTISFVTLNVTIPQPDASSGNKLTNWSVDIVDGGGKVYRSYNQSQSAIPPSTITFDGKDSSNVVMENGRYQARVTAKYLNGYETTPLSSPVFVLDTSKPDATIRIPDPEFGGAAKPSLNIEEMITAKPFAPVTAWTGKIIAVDPSGAAIKTVRTFSFGQFPPDKVVWDGLDSTGARAAGTLGTSGDYALFVYELSATDLAGNSKVIRSEQFRQSSSQPAVMLTMQDTAFSPNGDRVKDTISFKPVLKSGSEITDFTFEVKDSTGKVKATQKANKPVLTWDGKSDNGDDIGVICADGLYTATLTIKTRSGDTVSASTQPFTLDTKAPALAAEIPWTSFSPDGDGVQDVIPVSIKECTNEPLWTATVKNAKGASVKKFSWNGFVQTDGKAGFEWNGADESGNKAADGTYSLVIESQDDAGNSFSTEIKGITLDSREVKAYVMTENDGISPNGDGVLDTQKFTIRTTVPDGILAWNFDVCNEAGVSVRGWSDKDSANVPASIIWDGLDAVGKVAEGTFTGSLRISYKKGNKVQAVSSPFICSAIPPALKVQTAPEFFSPDNDGTDDDLFIKLSGTSKAPLKDWSFTINDPNGKAFWKTAGKSSITERIIWNGLSNIQKNSSGYAERVQSATDYPYVFTVRDTLGMTNTVTGVIQVDVLVIRDGSVLKMAVPSIIFRGNNADFETEEQHGKGKGVTVEQAKNDERVLNRIAEILNKFKDYKVTIVGHANPATGDDDEETVERPGNRALIPLSKERAEFVKKYLEGKGISSSRLTTEGKGGTELVADYKDKDNNWKNRRVEFILNK